MAATAASKSGLCHRYYASTLKIRGTNKPVGSVSRVNARRAEEVVFAALAAAKVAPPGAERSDLLERVERIVLHPKELEIQLKEDGGQSAVRAPVDLSSAMSAARFVDGDQVRNRPDAGLIKALVLAHNWAAWLEAGDASVDRIAKDAGVTKRYVWKTLRLAVLAPDMTEAILEGRQPRDLNLRRINQTRLPLDWRLQREALGFPQPF